MMHSNSNKKARIEKKISKNAKELLLKLMPKNYKPADFSIEGDSFYGPHGSVYFDVCVVWDSPDYWTGEQDYYDAFYRLHEALIGKTTDWDGICKAHDAAGWGSGNQVDESPFYSPFRLGGNITRAGIIKHCRSLVKAGITWE
ncbi:hypothetical protein U0D24_15635 [Hafnia paralvei]|uniref:hypothetical protein n=1 Tax=Hafnia paralvei TaxID=546367 RepID=UPI002FDBC9EF